MTNQTPIKANHDRVKRSIISALNLGMEIETKHATFRLFKAGQEVPLPRGEFGEAAEDWLGQKMTDDSNRTIYLGAHISISDVAELAAAEMSCEEDYIGLVAAVVLREIVQERATRRISK